MAVVAMVVAIVVARRAAAIEITAVAAFVVEVQGRTAPALSQAGQHCGVSAVLLNRPDGLTLFAGLFGEDVIGLGDRTGVIVRHSQNRDALDLPRLGLLVDPVERYFTEGLAAFEDFLDRARRPIFVAA